MDDGRTWSGAWFRMFTMMAAVAVVGVLAVRERAEQAEAAKRRIVFSVQLRTEGWQNDELFGRQYEIFYPGTIGRPPVNCDDMAELYGALGCRATGATSVQGGCSLKFDERPARVIHSVSISKAKAVIIVSGPVQRADIERMTEALLNMAWDAGVKARDIACIRQGTSPERWECEFVFVK